MKNTKWSELAVNTAMDAVSPLLDGGTMEVYSGTQPLSADDPVTTQHLLTTLTLGSPAFAPAVGGVAVANPISVEPDAPATGSATWYRLKAANGDVVKDGSVGTSNANLVLSSTAIVQHAEVSVTSYSLNVRKTA